jgi:hypothetical protein
MVVTTLILQVDCSPRFDLKTIGAQFVCCCVAYAAAQYGIHQRYDTELGRPRPYIISDGQLRAQGGVVKRRVNNDDVMTEIQKNILLNAQVTDFSHFQLRSLLVDGFK